MYEVVVGSVRLDVWKDGRGVVSRVGSGGSRIPADPEAFDIFPTLGTIGAGLLAASGVTCAGGVQLYRTGSGGIALAAGVVRLALAGVGAMFLFEGLFARIGRGRYVTLTGTALAEFRATAEAERSTLGDDPHKEEYKPAADRLWVLAQDLAVRESMDDSPRHPVRAGVTALQSAHGQDRSSLGLVRPDRGVPTLRVTSFLLLMPWRRAYERGDGYREPDIRPRPRMRRSST